MTENLSSLLYLASSVCFVLAIRGLNSPETARVGNFVGIFGMFIAILTTLALPSILSYELILVAILLGGGIGTFLALKTKMTSLPQLVALINSVVGLAACFVATAAFYRTEAYGIGTFLDISSLSIVEMNLGSAIGAITFTGSVIAFAKLQGLVSGSPVTFRGQHQINALLGIILLSLIISMIFEQTEILFWGILCLSFVLGVLFIIPIGGADMPVVISMLNSYSGWAACGIGFTL